MLMDQRLSPVSHYFGLDTQREGMMIAMIVHPPAFGMKLKSLDASEAKAMPGIHDVVTITTVPEGTEKQWSDTNAFNELVAVVGNTTWQVMKAKKALNISWENETAAESTSDHEKGLYDLLGEKQKNHQERMVIRKRLLKTLPK